MSAPHTWGWSGETASGEVLDGVRRLGCTRCSRDGRRRSGRGAYTTSTASADHLPPQDHCTELVTLLQAWIDEDDPEEQRETGEYLVRALDEDRLSDRKLFPSDLKGVTW